MMFDLVTQETKLVSGGDTPVICNIVEGMKVVLEVTGVAVCVNAHIGSQVRNWLAPIKGCGCGCGCGCACSCSEKTLEALREIACTVSVASSVEGIVALFRTDSCQ